MARVATIFWSDEERRARALWRVLLHAIAIAVIGLGPTIAIAEGLTALHRRGLFLGDLGKQPYDMAINMIVGPVLAAGILVATWACGRWLDHRAFRDFGFRVDRRWWRDWTFGLALGFALMTLVHVLERGLGWVRIAGFGRVAHADTPLALCLAFTVVKGLCVGPYEETVSRGYHLRNLAEGLRGPSRRIGGNATGWALALSALIFAALHAGTGTLDAITGLGLMLDGVMFGTAALRTGQLGLAMGLHTGWNVSQGSLFGFPVSGDREAGSLIVMVQSGPRWMTGGDYGPEGGAIGILASAVGVLAILAWTRGRTIRN